MTAYNGLELYSKPLFHVVLLVAYSIFTKKIKPLFYLFYLSAITIEFIAKSSIVFSMVWVLLPYSICFFSGDILLLPLIKKRRLKFKGINRIFILLVTGVLAYIILSMYFTFMSKLNSNLLYAIATLLFTSFLFCCFYITYVYNHPKSILLFLTGIGYSITCIFGLIMVFLRIENTLLFGLLNLSETVAQFCFVFFMIDFKEVFDNKDIIALED